MNEQSFWQQVWKRAKSFLWRLAAYLITAALAWLADNIGLLELHPAITTIIALGLGELSKAWANFMDGQGKTYFGRVKF
jgi:hypothetical protein